MPLLLGTAPNQVPTNGDLGTMAFQDAAAVQVGALTAGALTAGALTAGALTAASVVATGTTRVSNVDVLNASYDSVSFSVAAEEITPSALFFSADGRKMFVLGFAGDDVNEYVLGIPWVVSSATYSTVFSVAAQEPQPHGLFFRADGLKMYVVGVINDTVYQYALTSPWSVATASYEGLSFSVATQEISATGIFFKPDGLSMYVTGSQSDGVYQYTLSTAWNVSTATYLQTFNVVTQENTAQEISFTNDGTRMFVMGSAGDDVNVYNLTTPWNITTSTFVNSFNVAGQETVPAGFYIKPDGTKMYVVGNNSDIVYQYTVPSVEIQLTGTTSINGSATVAQDLTVNGAFLGATTINGISVGRGGGGAANSTAVGDEALLLNKTGTSNTAFGANAIYSNVIGNSNTAYGFKALFNNTASSNTTVGYLSGWLITTGEKNTVLGGFTGNQGGLDIRTSSNNIVLSDGDGNPRQIIDASGNVLIGTTTNTNSSKVVAAGVIESTTTGFRFPDASTQNTAATGFGFKNRIFNGNMTIDQRNAGASGTANAYTVDRFSYYGSQASKVTWQQNAGTVTPPSGFINYFGFTSSSTYSVVSTDQFMFVQRIEGLNVADLGWGTANAQTVTLSFWVRSSLTGTFGGSVQNSAANRCYPFSYAISAANTWEQKTVTIAGDTIGTWLTTNGTGLALGFSLGTGTTYSATAGAWTGSSFITSATGAVSVVGTSGATFYITGVQLEKGSTATAFDYRPYGTELVLCQRYFLYESFIQVPAVNSVVNLNYCLKVNMRVAPTVVYTTNNSTLATAAASISNALVTPSGGSPTVVSNGTMSISAEL